MTRSVVACVMLLGAAINVLMLASPIYMMQLYDRVLATRHFDTLLYLSLMILIALVALAGFDIVRSVVGQRLGAWIEWRLSGEVLGATVRLAHLAGAGRTVQGLRDLSTVRGLFANGALWPVLDVPWIPIFFVAIYLIHPVLFWCSLAGGAVLLLLALLNELATRRPMRDAAVAGIRANAEADAAVRNADAMTAMGMLPSFVRVWMRLYDESAQPQLAAGQRSAMISATARFFRLALQSAVLGVGAWLVIRGEITGGVMIAASILTARAVAPLEQAIASWRAVVGAQLAYKRLERLLTEAPRVAEGIQLPRPEGAVTVERVGYTIATLREPILRGVSFAVAPGENVAIIGPSGAGKTTLLRVVVGSLVPQAGVARLDGAATHQLSLADKNRYVGYLPQDVELFNGTVRENIARFTEARDEDVVAAAKAAGAHDTILKLPEGYQTRLGPGGVTLSGGQRQRIGLARALFGEPRLVVLDEPNANLDAEGEQALIAALRELRQRRATVLLVTQRMSLLSGADRVLMLRAGSVEAVKPVTEVIEEMTAVAAAAKGAIPAAPTPPTAAEPRRAGLWVMRGPRLGAEASATAAAERTEP